MRIKCNFCVCMFEINKLNFSLVYEIINQQLIFFQLGVEIYLTINLLRKFSYPLVQTSSTGL